MQIAVAQQLKAGFDKTEYEELMLISARTTAENEYYKVFPEPKDYKRIYQSKVMGLDNLWDLWTGDKNVAVISIRGTTAKPESWLSYLTFMQPWFLPKVNFNLATKIFLSTSLRPIPRLLSMLDGF